MSEWTPGGEPTQWSYQHQQPPSGAHLVQPAFAPTQPSTSSSSIQAQVDQWGSGTGYGQDPSISAYGQAGYASQESAPGGHAQFRQGPLDYPPSQPHYSHDSSYPPQSYPPPHHHAYPPVSAAPPPPPSQSRFESVPSNPHYRYDSTPIDLPVPPPASHHLSATAQRFQNVAPSPGYGSSVNPPLPTPSQAPQRNYAPSPRPSPAPASVQQYQRKVDELAMLEHRLAQLQSILSRGTMAETGPGSNQPILANQRAHLEVQVREFKNRQVNLLNECEAFTRHFGPASSWASSSVPSNNVQHVPSYPTTSQRSRTLSAGLHQQQQLAQNGTTQQYSYDSQANVGQGTRAGQGPQGQFYATDHDRQLSSNSYGLAPSQGASDRQPMQHGNFVDPGSRPPVPGARAGMGLDTYQQGPPHPAFPPHQRFDSSPNPGPSSYTHLPNPPHHEHVQPQRQAVPPASIPSNAPHAGTNYSYLSSAHPPQNGTPSQAFHHQQLEPQPLQPFPPSGRPSSRPSPPSVNGSTPVAVQQQQKLPPGLQAQVDALAREQAAKAGRARSSTTSQSANQNPLQVLIKKAENGEMPVMTMSGLRKQSDVEREKKLEEEEREKAQAEKNRSAATGTNGVNATLKPPTTVLAELCRQGGGPTLAEMVMTIDHQVFWNQLQQTCSKRNINVSEEVQQGNFVVETKPVDLLQLFQTVVSRGGGYGKIDAGNAWPHVATLLSISTRSATAHNRIKEIYHRIIAPFEDIWATQMIKLREKQRAMDEARRVLGAMPATASSTTSPHQPTPGQSSAVPQPPAPSPLAPHARLASTNQPSRRSPAQTSVPPLPAPGSSSMFANPIAYNSLPPSNAYPGGPTSLPIPQQPPSTSQAPLAAEKPVTSSDLLAQARALRNLKPTATTGGPGGSAAGESTAHVRPSTTSPPQETSSTPQETATTTVPAPAPIVDAPSKPSSVPTNSNSQGLVHSVVAASGHAAPFSTSATKPDVGDTASTNSGAVRDVSNPRKRKNDETDDVPEGTGKAKSKTRDRSMSNLEAPIVGQQTNAPHFNPFEINHFLPFTTAAPSIVPSPTAIPPHSLYSDLTNSAKSTGSQPSLRPDTSSTQTTISPQSIGDGAILLSPGTIGGSARSFDSVAKSAFGSMGKRPMDMNPSGAAVVNPSSFDSISLSMSLDPENASRPGTSWSIQDSSVSNGLSAFDTFGGGLDGYAFQATGFDDGLHGLDPHSIAPIPSNATGLPNWSPSGLDGFDFGSSFS